MVVSEIPGKFNVERCDYVERLVYFDFYQRSCMLEESTRILKCVYNDLVPFWSVREKT